MRQIILLFHIVFFISCSPDLTKEAQGNWIKGDAQSQIETIEKQFRGFDLTMVETGYRYQELYWAGQDQNWDYAQYQIEKIRKTLNNGFERRPKREKSAEVFINQVLPQIEKTIHTKDTSLFRSDFIMLTTGCNNCHTIENVPHFTVKIPIHRQSPIR